MPNEALWSQNVGAEYSAAEDRKLINAIWTSTGILNGLTVTPGVGRSVTVAAGRAIVPDGSGGAYLAYVDGTVADIPVAANVSGANRTDGVYATVDDPGTGETVIIVVAGDTPKPTDPYVKLATVTIANGATSISAASINNAVRQTAGDSRYLLRNEVLYGPLASVPATLPVGTIYLGYV